MTAVAGRVLAAAKETAGDFFLTGALATGAVEVPVLTVLLCAKIKDFTAG